MKFIGYRTLKTGIGASAAMIIASQLGLEYAVAAGVITILSIQNTKKQSFKIAIQRMGACILALFISSILFKTIGYYAITFGIFLLIFIPVVVKFNLEQGIVVSSVLVTHLLVQKSVSMFWICNELALMMVGIGTALVLNFYMPSIEREIKEDQVYIEEKMREILLQMAAALKDNCVLIKDDHILNELENRLQMGRRRSYKNLNNYLLLNVSYYVQYMEMRTQQFESIKRMKQHFQRFFMAYHQAIMIGKFTERVANSIYEQNTVEHLINELNLLRESFKKMPLPLTRGEFENRAMLFQFLNDMEEFLIIKNEFKQNITMK